MNYTDRLILSQPIQQDLTRFYGINSDPGTNTFNPNGPMNLPTAEKVFAEIITHWDKNGFGVWAISEKENPGYIIGFGGLSYRLYGDAIKLNLGYRFDKNYWGKGYATELSQYAIAFGLGELKKETIFAVVRPKHLVSVKVLEKCKMKLFGELDDVPGEEPSLVYKIGG